MVVLYAVRPPGRRQHRRRASPTRVRRLLVGGLPRFDRFYPFAIPRNSLFLDVLEVVQNYCSGGRS
jgi:hypothetical protein